MRVNKFVAFLFLVLFPITSFAQDEKVRGAVETKSGLLIVWNEPKNNFTLEVKGKDFERVPNKNIAFLVDGKFLQITSAFNRDFLAEDQRKEKLDEKAILTTHGDWESNYLGQVLGENLKIDSEHIKLSNSKNALLWSFMVPKNVKGEVKKQIFLSVTKGESVLVLNGAVTSTVNEEAVRRFLLETAVTLKVSEKALSRKEAEDLALKIN